MIANKSGYESFAESYQLAAPTLEKLITKCEEEDIRAPMKVEFEALVSAGLEPEAALELVMEGHFHA